jgi:antitoxin component YwqK of YwqJK toxin-antitoxin module
MEQKPNQRDAEGRPHGRWEHYYLNGTPRWRGHYLHGQWHGLWEIYYRDGTLQWRRHYYHGRLKGVAKRWNPQGGIRTKIYHLLLK